MARVDDCRTRKQQLYKNPFIGGGPSLAKVRHIFPNSTFSGFLDVSSQQLKLQALNLAQLLIRSCSTNRKTDIYP